MSLLFISASQCNVGEGGVFGSSGYAVPWGCGGRESAATLRAELPAPEVQPAALMGCVGNPVGPSAP